MAERATTSRKAVNGRRRNKRHHEFAGPRKQLADARAQQAATAEIWTSSAGPPMIFSRCLTRSYKERRVFAMRAMPLSIALRDKEFITSPTMAACPL